MEQTVHDSSVKNSTKTVMLAQMFLAELSCEFAKHFCIVLKLQWVTRERERIVRKQMSVPKTHCWSKIARLRFPKVLSKTYSFFRIKHLSLDCTVWSW